MRREGLQARGIYKEVPRPSRGLALATRQKIPYNIIPLIELLEIRDIFKDKAKKEGNSITDALSIISET